MFEIFALVAASIAMGRFADKDGHPGHLWGGILFLCGDNFDVYGLPEAYSEKDGLLFPNSDFSILRDAVTDTILGLDFNGVWLQAEEITVPDEEAYLAGLFMKNGEVTQEMSYDEVKRRLLAA